MALTSGCAGTFHEASVEITGTPPSQKPSMLVIGEVKVTDAKVPPPEQEVLANAFKRGLDQWSKKNNVYESIVFSQPVAATAASISINAAITEVAKGSAAERFWVGMGAGQARISGEVEIHGSDGGLLTKFKVRKSYLGGLGAGGADVLTMEDLAQQLGELTADSTWTWLQGKEIK
jgi:hypothetical protein